MFVTLEGLALSSINVIIALTMENEDIIRPLSDQPPRHCPVCEARVAEGAKTCLMCGAALNEEAPEETVPPPAARSQLSRNQVFVLGGVALVIFIVSIILGMNLSQGNVGAALPTFTPTITLTPTVTVPPTQTPTPTLSPTPQPSPTPLPPENYVVQSGDTLLSLVLERDLTLEEVMAYNEMESDVIVEGQTLLFPPPTPTPGPTPTLEPGEPTQTPSPYLTYVVRPGDTLSDIAEQFGISVAELRRVNDIPPDSETIRADQVLTIPQYTPTPEIETTNFTPGQPTPRTAYAPPVLLYPPDNTRFVGSEAMIVLQWASAGLLEDDAYYRMEVTVPTESGKETIRIYQKSTAWRVPENLLPSDSVDERTFNWRVSVVLREDEGDESDDQVIGPPARSRTFVWQMETP